MKGSAVRIRSAALTFPQSGLVWYAKFRTGTGRQIQKKLGPAWTRRGAPPAGHPTRGTAQRWLEATLGQIRIRTMATMAGTPARFETAAAEWLRHVGHDRRRKPTTVRGRARGVWGITYDPADDVQRPPRSSKVLPDC